MNPEARPESPIPVPVPSAEDEGVATPAGDTAAGGRDKTYHSISEVSRMLDVRPHVLRYWETQFPVLRPKKGRSGSRMYRERDVQIISRIKVLLYDKGFTIKGARRRIRLEQRKEIEERQLGLGIENPWLEGLNQVREELLQIAKQLGATRLRGASD